MTSRARTLTLIGGLCACPASVPFLGCSSKVQLAGERQRSDQDGGSQTGGVGGGLNEGSGGAPAAGSGGHFTGDTGGDGTWAGGPGGGGSPSYDTGGVGGTEVGGAGPGGSPSYDAGGAAGAGAGVGVGGSPSGGNLGAAGTPGSAGAAAACDLNCVTRDLTAQPSAGLFPVLPGIETTACFSYHLSNGAYTNATAFAAIVDNGVPLHDMSLFKMTTPQVNGAWSACTPSHPDGTAVWSWVPGTGATAVSMDLEPGDFILQVHYLNKTTAPQTDASGVRVCACPP